MRRVGLSSFIAGITATSAAFALSTQSCGTDTSGTAGGLLLGPPLLDVTAPCEDACFALPPGGDPTIPISLEVQNLDLRPPGVCAQGQTTSSSVGVGGSGVAGAGGAPSFLVPCGHIALVVCIPDEDHPLIHMPGQDHDLLFCPLDTQINNEGAGTQIDLLLRKFPHPFGKFHVDVHFVREAQNIFEFVDAEPAVVKQIDVEISDSCATGAKAACNLRGNGGSTPGTGGSGASGGKGLGGATGMGGAGGK